MINQGRCFLTMTNVGRKTSTISTSSNRRLASAGKPKRREGTIVVYHNPECGTSRNVVDFIQKAGYQPTIIEYVKEGWTKNQLLSLFAAADLTPRTALRETKSPAKELGLLDAAVSDDIILAKMLEFPVLVNRPIVCTRMGIKLCRPSEKVLDLLERMPPGPVFKEDGEMIIDERGERILEHPPIDY